MTRSLRIIFLKLCVVWGSLESLILLLKYLYIIDIPIGTVCSGTFDNPGPTGGFTYGNTPPQGCHVLFYEDNTYGHSLQRTNDSIEDAITHFKNELNLGHLVMVGVDYEGGRQINDGTVDHFVVLSGYGFDESGSLYFEYVETNRSASCFQFCYGDDFKFFYDAQERILTATRYERYETGTTNGEYSITQYRENNIL